MYIAVGVVTWGLKGANISSAYEPTMMLLMGMWISFTKKPIKPMMAKPMAVATAIFWNSRSEEAHV